MCHEGEGSALLLLNGDTACKTTTCLSCGLKNQQGTVAGLQTQEQHVGTSQGSWVLCHLTFLSLAQRAHW